jgi:hypothetical protein
MKKLMFGMLLLVVGCKGPAGSKGDRGDTGIHGPGQIVVLNGPVTSDDFNVTDSRIGLASQVNVYIGIGSEVLQLPIYNVAGGYNVLYAGKNPSTIEIMNALKGGAVSYEIVLII